MKKLLRLISVATMLLAATSFMACSSDDDDDSGARSVSARTSGSIVGVVLDNKGEPVEGATVTLGGKTAKTNYGGEFEITGVNPNDSKLISAAKTVTTTTTVHTDADNTVTNKPKTDTSISTTSTYGNSAASTDISNTGYTLTVKKDGYLSGKVTGIFVRYQDTEDPEVTRANALLHGLEYDYQDILDRYAAALTNVTANNGTTATTTTTATEDTTATTTVQTGSNADRVFKDISEAISALKSLYKTGSYTEYFSDFATSSPLIPLDASLKGRIKLNLKTKGGSLYDATTYVPASKPTVYVSYTSAVSPAVTTSITTDDTSGKVTTKTTTGDTTSTTKDNNDGTHTTLTVKNTAAGAEYTWSVQADENGEFVFDKNLPSGVTLTVSVGSFFEKIKVGEVETEYCFSSESSDIIIENSTYATAGITLGSKDANVESIVYMLYAENNKIWVSETNVVDKLGTGVLLQTTDALTFTFNKAMRYIDFVADVAASTGVTAVEGTKDINLNKGEYTAEWSEDKKTVTLKPNAGHWTIGGAPRIVLKGEAEDGATTFLNGKFTPFFDTKVWVSLKEDKVSYKDYNDYLKLSDPITLVFSRAMNDKVAVHLYKSYADNSKPENTSAYTESWNEAKTELTLTPVTEAKYWDVSDKSLKIVVEKEFASSKDTYNTDFGYWKTGAAKLKDTDNTCLEVFFDNYNDVTLTKTSDSEFTVTFAKALKDLTEKEIEDNITIGFETTYTTPVAKATGDYVVSDVKYTLDASHKVLTVKAQNTEFKNYGYYYIFFGDDVFVAETGEKNLRKVGTVDTTKADSKTPFVTTFTLGSEFKYTAVTVVEAKDVPSTAIASRAVYVDNDKYLKITFNKDVKTSDLKVAGTVVKNYIDGKDVYLPLAKIGNNAEVKVTGDVWSKDGQQWELTKSSKVFDTLYKVNELSYKMLATSLYELKASIAGNKNNAIVEKIAPTDTFTFTFDQDVSSATWTAELYDADNVGVKNLDQTAYVATPEAVKNVVTVTLSGKALDYGKTYYLSLKAANGTGDEAVVLYDSSAAAVKTTTDPNTGTSTTSIVDDANYDYAPNSKAKLNTVIMELKNSNKPYIKVQVKSEDEIAGLDNLYVVEASNNKASATTSFDEFKKSNTSEIVLELSVDISAVTDKDHVYLANDVYDWSSEEKVVKANTYVLDTDKTSVAGNKITLKAKYAFKSGSKVVPTVFNKTTGKRIELKTVEDKPYFVKDDGSTSTVDEYKGYTSLKFAQPTELSKVLDTTVTATKALGLTLVDSEKKIANGQDIKLKFTPVYAETKTETDYGTYTLYRKKTVVPASASTWEKVGTKSYVVKPTDSTFESLQYLKETTTGTGSAAKTEYSGVNAEIGDFAVRAKSAVIIIKALADEFDIAKTSEYKLVCEIDGAEIYSEAVKVTDNTVVLASDAKTLSGVTMPTTVAESALTGTNDAGTITVKTTAYLSDKTAPVYTSVKLGEGVTATSLTNKHISKLTTNKPVVKVGDDGKSVVITIGKDVTACLGDTITIDVYDVHEQKGTIEVVLK